MFLNSILYWPNTVPVHKPVHKTPCSVSVQILAHTWVFRAFWPILGENSVRPGIEIGLSCNWLFQFSSPKSDLIMYITIFNWLFLKICSSFSFENNSKMGI